MRPAMYIYCVCMKERCRSWRSRRLLHLCVCVCVCVCVYIWISGATDRRRTPAVVQMWPGFRGDCVRRDSSDGSRRISATAFLSPLPWLWLCKILRPGSTAGSLIPRCRGFVKNTRCTAKPITTLCIKALLTRESRFDLNWLSAWGRSHRRCSTWPRAAPAAGAAPAGCSCEGAGRAVLWNTCMCPW